MKYIDIPGSTRQHMLVYGLPGSGKTQLVSELTLAGFNLIWFSLDNGHGTIFDKLPLEARSRIDLCNMPDTDSYPISAVMLPRIFSDKSITLCYRHAHPACKICTDGFDTYDLSQHTTSDTIYVIDNLTVFTTSLWTRLTGSLEGLKESELFETEGDTRTLLHYGNLGKHIDRFLSLVKIAPVHVICLAQICRGDFVDKSSYITPAIGTRKYSTNVSAYFDHIIYCEVKNKSHEFYSLSASVMNVLAKSRSDIDIEAMEKPALAPFFGRPMVLKKEKEKPVSSGTKINLADMLAKAKK